MKKIIFVYIAAVLCVCSCKISDYEMRPVSHSELERYGCRLFAENVCAPLCLIELVYAFDEYMLLPDEEKEKNEMFYDKVSIVGDNVYSISDGRNGYIQCIVNTHGFSLSSGEMAWEISDLQVRVDVQSQGMSFDSYFSYTERFAVRSVGGSLELCIIKDEIEERNTLEVVLGLEEGNENGNQLLLVASGSERTADFRSVSATEPSLRVRRSSSGGWIFDGVFRYRTYRAGDEKMLDECSIIFKPGYLTKFEISR